MTLYARGYRRYEHGFPARWPRWRPMFAQGFSTAVRGRAFRWLTMFVMIVFVVCAALVYLDPGDLLRRMGGTAGGGVTAGSISFDLAAPVTEAAVTSFLQWMTFFLPLLAVFVGGGAVAEDLRTRALPLYLVRPITPLDYYFGKVTAPAAVLLQVGFLPALGLVLFAVLLRPSAEILPFAAAQGRVVGAAAVYCAVAAVAYASLVVLVSALCRKRVTAIVSSVALLFGGEIVAGIAAEVGGRGAAPLRAAGLPVDVLAIYRHVLGTRTMLDPTDARFPSPSHAWLVVGALVATCLLVVWRRARTAEVTS